MNWRPWRRKEAEPEQVVETGEADASLAPAVVVEPAVVEPAVIESPVFEPVPATVAAPEPAPAPAPAPASVLGGEQPEASQTRWARLRSRVTGGLGAKVSTLFGRGPVNQEVWDELEEILLLADVGAGATEEILHAMRNRLTRDPDIDPSVALRDALVALVDPGQDRSLNLAPAGELTSIVVVGVNGVGKTTTVGKLARVLVADGRSVVLGAADTFRAAAADQLETWGARVGVPVVRSHVEGADPASVAFDATQRAASEGADVVLIDTAGRLQNKQGLMDELGKIVRVASKVAVPRETLLVLDATTGQNGLNQARVFAEAIGLTGIVLTKLDGTAKGGIVIAVQRELGVPVKFVGLGEGADDLAPFDAESFVTGIVGN